MTRNEMFYIAKYKKRNHGYLVYEERIENISLAELQKIFNINPNDPDILIRNMVYCYDISEKESAALSSHVKFKFDFKKYNYQTCIQEDDNGNEYYVVSAFEKSTPREFVEECPINVDIEFLRELFKGEKYFPEPTEYGFSPYINLDPIYAKELQPFVSFDFDLDKYDYWVEKREEGQPREED